MTKDKEISFGNLKADSWGLFALIGSSLGFISLILIIGLTIGGFIFFPTFYNFEAGELTEEQVYEYLEDKHEAWFCNFDPTMDKHWCIGGKSIQIKNLSIEVKAVEIVEK